MNILAYLSHSYRPEDRLVNMKAWKRLNDKGLVFTVDPPSRDKRPMDVTFLERMMQHTHCFVAIIPNRSHEASRFHIGSAPLDEMETHKRAQANWSPYQELELRLALRAGKPRLVIVEKGIDPGPLLYGEPTTTWFDRTNSEFDPQFDPQFDAMIETFHAQAKAYQRESSLRPPVGILRWKPCVPSWQGIIDSLINILDESSITFNIVDVDEKTRDHSLLNNAHGLSMLVADLNPMVTPAYLIGFLHGAAIPIYRTCLLEPEVSEVQKTSDLGLNIDKKQTPKQNSADKIRLPLLLQRYRVDERMQPVLFWKESGIDEAVTKIVDAISDYQEREQLLITKNNASDYFLSLKGNRVFISTPGSMSEQTKPYKQALDEAGIPAFHYQASIIPGGTIWKDELERQIDEADLLLAFITEDYWRREECVDELFQAIRRWERHRILIVLYAPVGNLPQLPPFLARYQINRVSTAEMLVDEIRQKFIDNGRNETSVIKRQLQALVEKHLGDDLRDSQNLRGLLIETCKIPEEDAADIIKSIAVTANFSAELIDRMINLVEIEPYGGEALGRLCYRLRLLESLDSPERERLSSMFSSLRLFPNLHDIQAWNDRRLRTELKLKIKKKAPTDSYSLFNLLLGDNRNKDMNAVRKLGEDLAKCLVLDAEGVDITAKNCRISVDSSFDNMMSPFEWAIFPKLGKPLALACPMYRRLSPPLVRARASIEQQFDAGRCGPPRVLIFGYGPTELPNVQKEIKETEARFLQHYRERLWPEDIIDVLDTNQATWDGLNVHLSNSDYDILHIAGHAGFEGNKAYIAVYGEGKQAKLVLGTELGAWLKNSSVRFVYLSCCSGAAEDSTTDNLVEWRNNLCRAILEAGVSEVIAYFWPVSDENSVAFTSKFYETFLKKFDAPQSLYEARASVNANNPLWACSVLVKQGDG